MTSVNESTGLGTQGSRTCNEPPTTTNMYHICTPTTPDSRQAAIVHTAQVPGNEMHGSLETSTLWCHSVRTNVVKKYGDAFENDFGALLGVMMKIHSRFIARPLNRFTHVESFQLGFQVLSNGHELIQRTRFNGFKFNRRHPVWMRQQCECGSSGRLRLNLNLLNLVRWIDLWPFDKTRKPGWNDSAWVNWFNGRAMNLEWIFIMKLSHVQKLFLKASPYIYIFLHL